MRYLSASMLASTLLLAASWVGAAEEAASKEMNDMKPASATLKDAKGTVVGSAELRETPHGVLISLDLTGVAAGTHAFHIHQSGKCEGPDFTSAGGHFNPHAKHHGVIAPGGQHAGDLPNLHVPDSGKLKIEVLAPNVTLKDGAGSLFDADGSALMIHAAADDYKSDPAGEAGPRIACGVVEK